MELGTLRDAIDGLQASTDAELDDGPALVELLRQHARLEEVIARAAAAFSDSGDWGLDGARSGKGWLAVETRRPKPECGRWVRLGRVARELPHARKAWSEGRIGTAHVGVLVSLRNWRTEDALAESEELLVEQASELRFDQFSRAAAYWGQLADEDGADDDDQDRRNRRDVFLTESLSGMFLGKITLDPLSGAAVSGELERIYDELFKEDWKEAKARIGRDPVLGELCRTPAQRRADALVEMAVRSRTAPPGGRRPAPLFSVLVDDRTMRGRICELASGTVLAPSALLPWLDRAYIERVVFGPDARVEVSESARLFTGATRRAIELRDRECFHPYCDVPSCRCQADHIVPYTEGGPTTQENGRMACGYHNRARTTRPPPRE